MLNGELGDALCCWGLLFPRPDVVGYLPTTAMSPWIADRETGISSVACASLDTRAGRLPESLGQGCDAWIPSSLGLPVSDPFPLVPAADALSYKHRL